MVKARIDGMALSLRIKAAVKVPMRVRRMCPVLMFAASRNDRVRGRAEILLISIPRRKGFNQFGAPLGRRLEINLRILRVSDDIIMASQIGRAKVDENSMWEDGLKEYGERPIRFVVDRTINIDLRIRGNPFRLTVLE